MLQEHDDRLRIIRARTILDMLGERPATGRDLFRPLKGLDNAALLVRGGRVLDVLPWKSVRVPAASMPTAICNCRIRRAGRCSARASRPGCAASSPCCAKSMTARP